MINSTILDHSDEALARQEESIRDLSGYVVLISSIRKDKERGYRGERKGEEACLPALNIWKELSLK